MYGKSCEIEQISKYIYLHRSEICMWEQVKQAFVSGSTSLNHANASSTSKYIYGDDEVL